MTTRIETKITYTLMHEDIKALICEKYKLDPRKVEVSWYAKSADYAYDTEASLEFRVEIKENVLN